MTITEERKGERLTLALAGRLDAGSAPQLEGAAKESLDGVKDLTVDLAGVRYISPEGLRVLAAIQRAMNRQGTMELTHVNWRVKKMLEDTGVVDILTIR